MPRLIGDHGNIAIEYEASGRTARVAAYQNYHVTVLSIGNELVQEVRSYNDTAHMLFLPGD